MKGEVSMVDIIKTMDKYRSDKREVSLPVLLLNQYGDKDEAFFTYRKDTKTPKEWYKFNFENGDLVFYSKIRASNFMLNDIQKRDIDFVKVDHDKILEEYLKIRKDLYTDRVRNDSLVLFVMAVYQFMDKDLLDSYLSLGNKMFEWIYKKII